ncbi:MAG: helix-turn-helix domain-containing protein [Myxococcales bacterium]|nr:helix-turn-helix domain-containing protein [Myxococcales bacterium]
MEKLVDSAEAARLLKLSPRTLENWRMAGKGPSYRKLGGAVRYATADLEAFSKSGKRTRTARPAAEGSNDAV